ncbi:hypothetical protein B0H16DRAFT_1897717 [Mycena metata]|uniref:Uncharacterized protein n=1 Tax=Mycena metata TaxID=1033252 RepID=A0AAD7MHS9_9AGAR|nr:hypothetical protein B0H16DRAFT_1897717 [Mycena metata]
MDGDGDEMNEGGPPRTTPRNSVVFPAGAAGDDATPGRNPKANGKTEGGKRSLSELLRLHAEKGTDCTFGPEEAARVADVLRDWMNAGSSPYEDEDDFFARGSQPRSRVLKHLAAPQGAAERVRGCARCPALAFAFAPFVLREAEAGEEEAEAEAEGEPNTRR